MAAMRKIFVVLLGAAVVAALVPAAASAGKGKRQTEEGTIALPAPFVNNTGCFAGLHRRAAIVTAGNNNGAIGYHFEVDKATWKKPFVLEATGGHGHVDLDIYFYLASFGTPEDVVNDPGGAGNPPAVQFNTREAGGEADKVPAGAERVIICMYGGDEGAGVGATFEYNAGKGVKLPKG